MEVRDPVHGSIHILDEEIPIIEHAFFQRLRNIKQLGLCEYVFPGATHSRFLHSIGVMTIGTKAFDKIFRDKLEEQKIKCLRETFKLACLLHDIGHAPLSHSTETVMPRLSELEIPARFLFDKDKGSNRQATHEDYTIKAIVDSDLTKSFTQVQKKFGLEPKYIADLVTGKTNDKSFYTYNGINYFPVLHQLISSELDCDRMDYLLRDSYFCGVSYGNYDLDWLIDNIEACIIDNSAYLGISERAIVTFDDFLLSRYHMFLMVYFHYKAVCLEQLLFRFFKTSPDEYKIPSDINEYIEHDDHLLMKVLRKSDNPNALAIIRNCVPKKIFESFNPHELSTLSQIQNYLKENKIDYIRCSSTGRLSKYSTESHTDDNYSIKVIRTLFGTSSKIYSNINDATDLFEKFSESHAVNRLHCDFKSLTANQKNDIISLIHAV